MSVEASLSERLPWLRLRDVPKIVGSVGIGLGLVAFWLTLPPLAARAVVWPIVLGIPAVAAGIWAASRGARRVGWAAVAVGLLGIALGLLATRSSVGNLDRVVVWSALLGSTLRYCTPSSQFTFAPTRSSRVRRSTSSRWGSPGICTSTSTERRESLQVFRRFPIST